MSDDPGSSGGAIDPLTPPQEEPILYAMVGLLTRDINTRGHDPNPPNPTSHPAWSDTLCYFQTALTNAGWVDPNKLPIPAVADKLARYWLTTLSSNGQPRTTAPDPLALGPLLGQRKANTLSIPVHPLQ